MGKAIAFINDKGGVTKSTSCICLADYYYRVLKKSVVVVDIDPRHQCLEWSAMAEHNGIETPLMVANSTAGAGAQIEKLKENYDYIFVDGMSSFITSNRQDMIAGIIVASDYVFIPTEPNMFDFWAIEAFAPIVKQRQALNDGKPYTYLYGARVRENTNEWKAFLEIKNQCPFPVLDAYIPLDVEYPRTTGQGKTPLSLTTGNKAHQSLMKWASALEAAINE